MVNEIDVEQRREASIVAWATVGILLVMAVLSYLDRSIISLMVGPIRKDLGITDFQIGLIQGVGFGVFYALFGLPVGYLVDWLPRRWVIYCGVTIWSLAAAGCGLAGNYQQLMLARFGVGMGEAALSPAAYSIIADIFPRRRLAFALSVFGTGSVLGSAAAFIGGGAAIAHFQAIGPIVVPFLGTLQSWQIIFLLGGSPGVLLALLIFLVPEPLRPQKRGARLPVTDEVGMLRPVPTGQEMLLPFLVRERRFFLCHFTGFGLLAAATYGGLAWLPTMLLRRFHLEISHVGLMMGSVSVFAGIPGFLLSGWIVDRWFAAGCSDAHQRYYAYANAVAAVIAAIAFLWAPGAGVVILAWGLITLLQPFTGPSAAQLQIVTPAHLRGRVSALYVMMFNLMGMCLGPPLVAFITDYVLRDPDRVNVSLAISYAGLAGLAALAMALGLGPSRRAVGAQ